MKRFTLALLLLVACNDDSTCTLVGCGARPSFGLGTFTERDITPTSTANATVDVCLNERCGRVVLHGLPTAIQSESDVVELGTPAPLIYVYASRIASNSINVTMQVSDGDELLADGDRYHMMFTSADGQTVVDRTWSVDYESSYPNGPDCGVCRRATNITEI